MDLDGARNAQAEILGRVLGYSEIAGGMSAPRGGERFPVFRPPEDVAATRQRSINQRDFSLTGVDIRRRIGVGIAPPREPGRDDAGQARAGYGIVLFCQRNGDRNSRLVDAARKQAKGEVRVVYTGVPRAVPAALAGGATGGGGLEIGKSIGHYNVTGGTLGCFVDTDAGVCVLSNNHVLANGNSATKHDDILSPAWADGGRQPGDRVAALHRWEDLDFRANGVNFVDAAVGALVEGVPFDRDTISGLPNGPRQISKQVSDGSRSPSVFKVGRTTRYTQGRITAFNVVTTAALDVAGFTRLVNFTGQISIEGVSGHFSRAGDSGSVVFDDDMNAVGLLFAGTDTGGQNGGGITYANPMAVVLAALHASL
jgi:hypothetical protein